MGQQQGTLSWSWKGTGGGPGGGQGYFLTRNVARAPNYASASKQAKHTKSTLPVDWITQAM